MSYPEKMTLPAKVSFELGATGGVRKATEHFLNLAGIPFNGSADRFAASNEDGTFVGVRSILRVARSVAAGAPVELLGSNASERVVVDQWVATALQVNANAIPLVEVEPMIPSRGFLAGGKQASVGDIYMYCVAAETALVNAGQYPNLAAWAKGMERNELFAQVKVEVAAAATSSTTAGGDAAGKKEEGGKGGKGGKEKAARPSEEQLAKLRAEKEAAKAAKEAAKKAEGGDGEAGKEATKPKKEDKKKKVIEVTGADLDLRIGHVISCEKHPESEKLYIEKIELGDPEGPRTILSGLQMHLKAEEIAGQNVLVLCNMKPKPLAGIPSHGMVLCASNPEGQLCLVTSSPDTKPGTRVTAGATEVPEALAPVPSSKVMDELVKHFSSDASGVVHWQDKPLLVGGKTQITAKIPNALVK